MTEFSRRTFLYGTGALLGATSLPARRLDLPDRTLSAKQFVDSIGIATHPCWRNTIWGSSQWAPRLIQSGVKSTRADIVHGAPGRAALGDLRKVCAQRIKICALLPGRSLDRREALADLQFLADEVGAENLCGIEGANEYNNPKHRPVDWASRLREFQAWLYEAVRSNSHLAEVPVIAPAMWNTVPQDCIALGNLEPNVDRGAIHYYTGGQRPTRTAVSTGGDTSMAAALSTARLNAPHRPLFATEFGYNVAGAEKDLSPWVITERAAAKYLLRGLLELFANGVEKTFIYALVDIGRPGHDYGLLDSGLNPRMSFNALRNLMNLFDSVGGAEFAMREFDFRLSAVDPRLEHLLFQKSRDTFLLTLSLDADSYDRKLLRDIDQAPARVVLTLAQPASKISVFNPLVGEHPVQSAYDASSAAISITDELAVVEITTS